nr:hypothetical protein CFP56_17057 [Quercus suber]
MPSIPFNALSKSSSISCTYPPTTKLSKHSTAVDERKPITRNLQKRSPLFNKHSSSPSLHLGHHCCHCRCLHSQEVVAKMVKQKKSMDGGGKDERADWKDPKELEAFCRFCAVQVMDGQRKAIGFLSKIGVNDVI